MKRLKTEGEEIELGKMIGEGFNVKKLLKLNRMKLDSGIVPDQTFVNQTDITQRDIA